MKKYLFLFLSIFTAVTVFYFFLGWSQLPEGQRYIYSLDDVYIHLALARNFAEHGVWSVNTTGFDSASSSILYTLLLSSLIKLFGNWEYYPLFLNIFFGYLTVYAVYRYLSTFYGSSELKWASILLLPYTLLHYSVLISMEHTIHMFLMVVAVHLIHRNTLAGFRGSALASLLTVTFLISMVRFESMFFTVSLAFALMLRQNFQQGITVLAAGFIPITVFGLISMQSGGFFFPNSVLIKGSYPSSYGILESAWHIFEKELLFNKQFYKYLFLPFVILVSHLIIKYRKKSIRELLLNETLLLTVISVGLLQSLFAVLDIRYENYVLISVLLVLIPVISSWWKEFIVANWSKGVYNIMMIGGISGVAAISVYRFSYHHPVLRLAPRNISEQQVEMSRFLNNFYSNQKVVANDIGAISYFGNVQLLDIVGLGSTEVTAMYLKVRDLPAKEYNNALGNYLARYCSAYQYKIAVIYTDWFPGDVPEHWTYVASWDIEDNQTAARDRVDFYALNDDEVEYLRCSLQMFSLNPKVKQTFCKEKAD